MRTGSDRRRARTPRVSFEDRGEQAPKSVGELLRVAVSEGE